MEKLAFTFWDGPQLSLLNILSLLSFARLNPDTFLTIYTLGKGLDINAGWKTGEHDLSIKNIYLLEDLKSESNIRIEVIDSISSDKLTSVVQVADYVRIEKLFEHGGIWIDTDILFFKKIPEKIWQVVSQNGFVISYENTITTGFMGFAPRSHVADLALKTAQAKLNSVHFQKKYEAFGPNLWREIFLEHPEAVKGVSFLSEKLVYPILWKNLDRFFFQENESINYDETIGIHWYGGSQYSRSFNNENLLFSIGQKTPLTNFGKIIHRLNNEINLTLSLPPARANFY